MDVHLSRLCGKMENASRPHWYSFLVFAGVTIALYSLIVRGVGFVEWLSYGSASYAFVDWKPQFIHSQFLTFAKANSSPLFLLYHHLFGKVFSSPALYVTASALSIVALFLLTYSVASALISSRAFSLLCAVATTCAQPRLFGFSLGDFWGQISYDHHQMCIMFLLGGMALALRKHYFFGAMSCALAFHLHSLNALIAYGFLIFPFCVSLVYKREYKGAFWLALLPAVSVLFFALKMYLSEDLALATSSFGIHDWFQSAISLASKYDNSIAFNTMTFVPFLFPIMTACLAVLKEKKGYEYYSICFFLGVTTILLGFEICHRSGIFFGSITVWTTILATFRGFWVIMLLATIGALRGISAGYPDDTSLFILSLILILHLFTNSLISSAALSVASLYVVRLDRRTFLWLSVLNIIGYGAFFASTLGVFGATLVVPIPGANARLSFMLCLLAIAIMTNVKKIERQCQLFFMALFCLLLAPNGQTIVQHIHEYGELLSKSKISISELLVRNGKDERKLKLAKEALSAVEPYARTGPILTPMDIPAELAFAMGVPLYICQNDVVAYFNFKYAQDYNSRLEKVFDLDMIQIRDSGFPGSFDRKFAQLDSRHLKSAMRQEGIPAAITFKPRKGFNTIFQNDSYCVVVPQ